MDGSKVTGQKVQFLFILGILPQLIGPQKRRNPRKNKKTVHFQALRHANLSSAL